MIDVQKKARKETRQEEIYIIKDFIRDGCWPSIA
jgi:hypothetical protein